jgi:hypothetical protein
MDNGKRAGAQSVLDVFEINGVPLTPSVNDRRLYSVHEHLTMTIDGQPRLQFWAEGCPTLIQTIPQQQPNKSDPERMADSRTDHHTLTLSYFTSGGVSGFEPAPTAKPIPKWLEPRVEQSRVLGHESVRK